MATSLRLNVDMKSTGERAPMSIGEVAARFGLATHVLRHWESVGLLAPGRAVAGRRRYGEDHLYRIAVILRAKEAGFGLDDIREMITAPSPDERTAILRRQRAELARRIARAQASLHLIDCALACDHEDFTSCPNFQAMLAERVGASNLLT
jgi:DNA-binding transcriptional MerR regulator